MLNVLAAKFRCIGVALVSATSIWLTCLTFAETPSIRLREILAGFDEREVLDNGDNASTLAHMRWLETERGKHDLAFLIENSDQISPFVRAELAMELGRTGSTLVIPLVKQVLEDKENGKLALAGVFYACNLNQANQEFRKALAPSVIPWIGNDQLPDLDSAIGLLVCMDEKLARETLVNDKYLFPDARHVRAVLHFFNKECLSIPLNFVESLITHWIEKGNKYDSYYRDRNGLKEAIHALAFHQPQRALEMTEQLVQQSPGLSEAYSEVVLAACGFTKLYQVLCEYEDDAKRFDELPESAKVFFSVTFFEAAHFYGGIAQAFGGPSGNYLLWVRKGYAEIGEPWNVEWLDFMCRPFGIGGPSKDRERRNQQMMSMTPSFWDQEDELKAAYEEKTKDREIEIKFCTKWALSKFALKHVEVLKHVIASNPVQSP
ncbi:hypothetical protein FEM03_02455 [Phragmitibacter flavus]|uniref:DNA mimic protein DMP19 C-terminal domain-containing protein n=1 Tax=Phragmitibacter flavus TaxID=2576071 RepID=A0A5R8KIT6_9BACT|nr:hypothetical protein [Phragmitibacter flavus]TLD72238.1 hypothetical protein FEM03_02455 [Phragmitibacter flavus]